MRRCDFCGGKLGLVVYRKWGRRFFAGPPQKRPTRAAGAMKASVEGDAACRQSTARCGWCFPSPPFLAPVPPLWRWLNIRRTTRRRRSRPTSRSALMQVIGLHPSRDEARKHALFISNQPQDRSMPTVFCVRAAERIERKPHAAGGVQVSLVQGRAECLGADHLVDQRRADACERPADERDRRALRADRNQNCCRGTTALRCPRKRFLFRQSGGDRSSGYGSVGFEHRQLKVALDAVGWI
jgi:hypothetical protein